MAFPWPDGGAGVLDRAELQDTLIDALQQAQLALLQGLQALGAVPDVHGQPAWPFARRLAVETLAIDGPLTRQLAWLLLALTVALLLVFAGLVWRRRRIACAFAALLPPLLVLGCVGWPRADLLLTDAHPTSFHRAPDFRAGTIVQGLAVFGAHCASCHGDDGAGEGPRAAALVRWPPRLTGELLWKRLDGEVFWRIAHGMHDRDGRETMPGFADRLDDAQLWSTFAAMKALAAGESVRRDGTWSRPIHPPDALVRCNDDGDGAVSRRLSDYRGQRLRLVALAAARPAPPEDPRLLTIVLRAPGEPHPADAGCRIDDAQADAAYARVAGASEGRFAGAQLLVDRDGWLRAYAPPGRSNWSSDDLLCRSDVEASPTTPAPARGDGLAALIAAMDADPIRAVRWGSVHRPR